MDKHLSKLIDLVIQSLDEVYEHSTPHCKDLKLRVNSFVGWWDVTGIISIVGMLSR